VMIRGIEGKRIFRDTLDPKDFVTRLGDLSEQSGIRILAWPLLGEHVHGF
jgi:REP element-mobilizing transposase RayT